MGSLVAGHRVIAATEAEQNVRRSVEPVLAANADAYVTEENDWVISQKANRWRKFVSNHLPYRVNASHNVSIVSMNVLSSRFNCNET